MLHPETERKSFGARLAKVRAQAGYTLESAATELTQRGFPIRGGTIGAWETGRNVPDALALRWLARLYQVPVDVLFSDAPVSLETIQLAERLKAVVLHESSQRTDPAKGQQTPMRQSGKSSDELFNLTNRGVDASDQSGRSKKQGVRKGTPGTGRPRRKG